MFVIIPVRRRVYFCPHCRARQRFFSWIPVWTRLWTCPRCGRKFQIDASCLGSNWAMSFALWSIPIVFVLAEPLIFVAAILDRSHNRSPFPPTPVQILGGVVVGGGAVALLAAIITFVAGYFAGLIYGAAHEPPRRADSPRPRRRKRREEDESVADL